MGFIIAGAIILLILILKIGVRVRATEALGLTASVGIFRVPILPKKEKTLKLSDYKIKKFRKAQEKLQRKAEKAAAAKASKKKAGEAAKTAKKVKKAQIISEDAEEKKLDIPALIRNLTEVAGVFFGRFGKHLHIKLRRLVIVVATPSAADTAVMYGAVCGGVQCFLELLENSMHFKVPKNAEISVAPDFTSEKLVVLADVTFSFRVWQLFSMIFGAGFTFIKNMLKNKE